MPCQLTIIPPVRQIEIGGQLFVQVQGTVTQCNKIIVKLDCHTHLLDIDVLARPDGTWIALFPHAGCSCNKDLTVNAVCSNNDTCSASYTGPLECDSDCPIIQTDFEVLECNNEGKRCVKFTLTLTDAQGIPIPDIIPFIDFGDGNSSGPISLMLNIPQTINHCYLIPFSGTPKVIFFRPETCIDIPIPLLPAQFPTLLACFECPTENDVHVLAGACTGNPPKRQYTITIDPTGSGILVDTVINFGDGTDSGSFPVNVAVGATVPHLYVPRSMPYNITVQMENCPLIDNLSTGVVTPCDGPPPPPSESSEESEGCFLLRGVFILLSALLLVTALLAVCFPEIAEGLLIISAAAAIGATIIFLIWYFACPKPCGWGYLQGWQISITSGIGLLYYSFCCNNLLWVGLPLVGAAIGLFVAWIRQCHPTKCEIYKELSVVVVTLLLPIIGWIANVGVFQGCINPIVDAILISINGIIVLLAASCISRANDDSQTA